MYKPDNLKPCNRVNLPPPPDWRHQCYGSGMRSRWRACLQALMVQRLGRAAGESQPFTNPITGKNCKTCVLTRKRNANNDRVCVHRFRSYAIWNSVMEGSPEERNCPIWKIAWIAISGCWEDAGGHSPQTILGNDHGHIYAATKRGDCDTDREAYDEMAHIFNFVDDSCFVSIVSFRKQNILYRQPVGFGLLQTFEHFVIGPNGTRPGIPEMNLPESATVHRFQPPHPSEIKSGMLEAWDQVLKELNESITIPQKHIDRFVICAARLGRTPCSQIGFVDRTPSESASIPSLQEERRVAPNVASDDASNHGTGALYDVTTSNYHTISTG